MGMDGRDRRGATPRAANRGELERLGDLLETDRGRFGAKGVNLARMARRGLPVPEGFAMAFEADHTGVLSSEESRLVRDAYAELARGLGCDAPAVAVRSSAAGEDGAEHSFAGQYTTRLDVIGEGQVIRAVEECLADRTHERVRSYRAAAGASAGAMGVVVQQMLHPQVAGVCFTRSPVVRERDEVVIEVVEGIGESLVSGESRPSRIRLARSGLDVRGEEDLGGALERLGRDRARAVARLSLAAERELGCAADVEWALADDRLWLLQCRPITAVAGSDIGDECRREEIERLRRMADRAGRTLVWSDFSVADMIPRPSSLAFEMMGLMMVRGGSQDRALRALGLRFPDPAEVGGFFELICGRAYLNLDAAVSSLDEALPVALDASRVGEGEGRGADLEDLPVRPVWRGWRWLGRLPAALLRWLFVVLPRFVRMRRWLWREIRELLEPAVTAEAAGLRRRDLSALDNSELWADLCSHVERFLDMLYYHQLTDTMSFVGHFLLGRWLRRLYGDRHREVEIQLTTGLPHNFNIETNLDLARVAAGELELGAFLARYGHRGSPDYEISAPRWREDPGRVEAMVRTLARAGVEPLQQFERQRQIRARAEAQLSIDIRGDRWMRPWRRAILRELTHYQCYSPLRESTQGLAFLFVELARRTLLEAARRTGLGELIFFFELAELERLILEGADAGIAARARDRRHRLQAARRIDVPHLVRSDDLEAIGRAPAVDAGARELTGLPVSSGTARGRARVVQSLDEALGLEAGEILVAVSADPSWTPLFLVAGALVLEQGGMLSHPAIVAREYGLPAVVNVPHATHLIRTGQPLRVDADRGRVVLEEG